MQNVGERSKATLSQGYIETRTIRRTDAENLIGIDNGGADLIGRFRGREPGLHKIANARPADPSLRQSCEYNLFRDHRYDLLGAAG